MSGTGPSPDPRGLRLLLVGAFPYPHPQGSQVYFQEQAIALRAAGADVELLTYGPPERAAERAAEDPPFEPERWRALDGFVHHTLPASKRPRSARSGPNRAKPAADLALARVMTQLLRGAKMTRPRYDAILTHNLEACVIALSVRARHEAAVPPILYCVHTLMEHELSAYPAILKDQPNQPVGDSPLNVRGAARRVIDRVGGVLDRQTAQRVKGWIALSESASRVMRSRSTRPGALIPPPIPDPRHRLFDASPETLLHARGLTADAYFLYTGNLDGYQELDDLVEAARRHATEKGALPVVLASFDPRVASQPPGPAEAGILRIHVDREAEMQALVAGARATLVTRKARGGFPIKLANSLAHGTPAIAYLDHEWGLRDGLDVERADPRDPVRGLAQALERLARAPERAARLGRGARARYEAAHEPSRVASETLRLIDEVLTAEAAGS